MKLRFCGSLLTGRQDVASPKSFRNPLTDTLHYQKFYILNQGLHVESMFVLYQHPPSQNNEALQPSCLDSLQRNPTLLLSSGSVTTLPSTSATQTAIRGSGLLGPTFTLDCHPFLVAAPCSATTSHIIWYLATCLNIIRVTSSFGHAQERKYHESPMRFRRGNIRTFSSC